MLKAVQAVSVGTTAVQLDVTETDRVLGETLTVIAQGTGTLVIGGDNTVTATTGARIPCVSGTTFTVDLDRGEAVWAIVASGTLIVDTIRRGA